MKMVGTIAFTAWEEKPYLITGEVRVALLRMQAGLNHLHVCAPGGYNPRVADSRQDLGQTPVGKGSLRIS